MILFVRTSRSLKIVKVIMKSYRLVECQLITVIIIYEGMEEWRREEGSGQRKGVEGGSEHRK